VSVHGGLILLEGKIRTYEERKRIGRIVWNTPGVAKVLNQLSVSDPETVGPAK
jgi:osmotically-inducible protein OsmY